jgi:hypothetical protein
MVTCEPGGRGRVPFSAVSVLIGSNRSLRHAVSRLCRCGSEGIHAEPDAGAHRTVDWQGERSLVKADR